MKIKRNLSDADMFRGIEEEESFETAVLNDDSRSLKIRKNFSAIKKGKEGVKLGWGTATKIRPLRFRVWARRVFTPIAKSTYGTMRSVRLKFFSFYFFPHFNKFT